MFLRRLVSTSKRPGWATVFIEFALIIFGVLIALQVNNWNTAQANRKGAGNTLTLLRSEVETNIATLEDRMAVLKESSAVRQAGMAALYGCDTSPGAQEVLGEAVSELTGDIIPSLVDSSLRELARQDRYLDLLSNEFRAALNVYNGRLVDERDQLKINFGLMWDQHVIKHPTIGIQVTDGDVLTSKFVVSQSLEVLCQNSEFRRQFAMTEGWHQSAKLRMQRFMDWSEEFLGVIDTEIEAFR